MRQIFGFWYALFLISLLAVLTLMRLNGGVLLILSFDGDAIHMAQIVHRMAEGQIPHADFLTPLGAMAFLPIVWIMQLGLSVGYAFALAPVFLALVFLPAVYWVGVSRLSPSAAMALGTVFLVQMTALVHGGTEATVAVSMYYNNWCWAVSGLIAVMVALPNQRPGRFARWAEPVFLGVGMGFLVLTKAPFAVFLLPAVVIGLLMAQQGRLLGWGVGVSLVFLAVITAQFGMVSYWQGYVGDLIFVSQSAARAAPGDPLAILLLRPEQIVGVLGLIGGFILLRQGRLQAQALLFLLLAVGWVLISHQNWQNDPHWLMIGGLILISLGRDLEIYNRFGWPVKTALRTCAGALLIAGVPLLVTQFQSLLVHAGLKETVFTAALTQPKSQSLRFRGIEDGHHVVQTAHPALDGAIAEPTTFQGRALPTCQKINGLVAELVQTGAALNKIESTVGAQVIYADWVNALWLFSKTEPLQGGAPWYYGGTPGFENAQFLVVPKCPMGQAVRALVLDAVTQDPMLTFVFVKETPLFLLYEKAPQ